MHLKQCQEQRKIQEEKRLHEQARIQEAEKQELEQERKREIVERRGQEERVKERRGKDMSERRQVKMRKPKVDKVVVVGRGEDKDWQLIDQKEEVKESLSEQEERRRVETCCQLERKAGVSIGRMRGAARAIRR